MLWPARQKHDSFTDIEDHSSRVESWQEWKNSRSTGSHIRYGLLPVFYYEVPFLQHRWNDTQGQSVGVHVGFAR